MSTSSVQSGNEGSIRQLWYGAALLLVVLLVYSGGIGNDFLVNWDDHDYVTQNPDIKALTLENLYRIFSNFYSFHYAPVQMLSYMVDYAIWGEKPLAFLLVNAGLHALNAYLYFRILCYLRLATGWAWFAALLFAVHPIQVESVAWISERKNVLAMAFFLASFQQYLCYAQAAAPRRRRAYSWSLVWFVLALLTKSVVVVLPAMLLAYDVVLRTERGSLRTVVLEKLPYLVLGLGVAGLAVYSQKGSGDFGGLSTQYLGGSIYATVLTMLTVYKDYLFNLFWPVQLSAIYQVDVKNGIDFEVCYSALLMAGTMSIFLLLRSEGRRDLVFWSAVFLIGFIPVSQIVPFISLMNDRYLYFPMLGFAAVLVLLLKEGIQRFPAALRPARWCGAVLVLLLSVVSWQRTQVWADSISLWQDAVRKQPDSPYAWRNLGNAYDHYGRHQEAIAPYQHALTLVPTDYETYYNLGTNFLALGELPSAVDAYRQALNLNADYVECLHNLGLVYTQSGQYVSAMELLSRGLRITPDNAAMRMLLGVNRYATGELPAAWQTFDQVRRDLSHPELVAVATGGMALVALRLGEVATSSGLFQEAVARGITPADLYFEWARFEAMAQRREQTVEYADKALSLGFRDRSAFRADPVFTWLRNDSEWLRLIGR